MKKIKKILFVFVALFLFVGVVYAIEFEEAYKQKWDVQYDYTAEKEVEYYDVAGVKDGSISVGYYWYSPTSVEEQSSYDVLSSLQEERIKDQNVKGIWYCSGIAVKYNAEGEKEWEVIDSISSPSNSTYYNSLVVVDDGFVVLAEYYSSDVDYIYLVKYDFEGNEIWRTTILDDQYIDKYYFTHMNSYEDKFIVSFDDYVYVYNSKGEKLATLSNGDIVYPVVDMDESGIYVGGLTYDGDAIVKKYDYNYNEVKSTIIYDGTVDDYYIFTAGNLVNDNFVVTIYNEQYSKLIVLNNNLEVLKMKDINTVVLDITDSRGDIVVVGIGSKGCAIEPELEIAEEANCDSTVLEKYNFDLDEVWEIEREYDFIRLDFVSGGIVTVSNDDNYIGYTTKYVYPTFNVSVKIDGNGEVTPSKIITAEGEKVEFTVTPKDGYQLKKVIVTTAYGEIVEFTDYKFIMPSDDVEIYAEFEKVAVNPNTGISNPYMICGIVLVGAGIGYCILKKKKYI